MDQEALEERVRRIFEQQGFEVGSDGNRMTAVSGDEEKLLSVYSSRSYTPEDVISNVQKGEIVFVDERLSGVDREIENEVSVIRKEKEGREFDLPSYELVGDIAVINEIGKRERGAVVEGIRHHHPRVKTVLLKQDGLEGEFRVGEYEILYGDETETVHTEFGCRYRVDPTKVYFSERFATERERVVSKIDDGEKVLVMFAGVGPFAVLAARNASPSKVVAVEKNPVAVGYLRENVEMNGVQEPVDVHEGDVSDIVPELGKFDRIIMPLPESADEYLPLAIEHAKDKGVIHYYRFLEAGDWETLEEEVETAAGKAGRRYELLERVICGHRGPETDRICMDIEVG